MEERKKSELPEKPKTPQQLWYNHEKKALLKTHPDVSLRTASLTPPLVSSATCGAASVLIYPFVARRPPKTSRTPSASSGRSCPTRRGSSGSPSLWSRGSCTRWGRDPGGGGDTHHLAKVLNAFLFVRRALGDDAGVHPAAPRVKHDARRHREVHPDQGREAPEG